MFTRKTKLIGGGILTAIVLAAVAGVVAWNTLLPHDAPAAATLESAVAGLDATQPTTTGSTVDGLTGQWTLVANGQSFVGYRVNEQLAALGAFTAVGRTTNLTAALTFDGSAITDVTVNADLTGLQSDDSRRDGALRSKGLETATYPTASFVLTEPIELDAVPAENVPVTATAVGDLTVHGVTRPVSIDLQGQFTNGYVVVVGSLEIAFADFSIPTPTSALVLSVEDHGVMELQLVFGRDANQG